VTLVDGNSVQATESHGLQHVSGVRVDLDSLLLQSRHFGNKVQSSLSLLFLQFQRDTTDGSLGNTTHQVCCVTSDLIAHALRRQNRNIVNDTFVRVEVHSQTSVVLLYNRTSRLLYSLRSNTLFGEEEKKQAISFRTYNNKLRGCRPALRRRQALDGVIRALVASASSPVASTSQLSRLRLRQIV
jgi:hypothetical protein